MSGYFLVLLLKVSRVEQFSIQRPKWSVFLLKCCHLISCHAVDGNFSGHYFPLATVHVNLSRLRQ